MRNTIKLLLLSTIVILCSVYHAEAQSATGSVYNIFGLGTMSGPGIGNYRYTAQTGIGVRSGYSVNLENPASLTSISGPTHIFDVDLAYKSMSQSSETESFNTAVGGLQSLNVWLRTGRKMAVSAGLKTFSDGRYDITDNYVYSSVASSYSVRHQGTGGLTNLYLSGAYQLTKHLSVGSNMNFIFGNMSKYEALSNNVYLNDVTLEQDNTTKKVVFDFGAQVWIPMFKHHRLNLGVVYRPSYKFNIATTSKVVQSSTDSLTTVDESSVYLPAKYGVGLEYRMKKWAISLDADLQKWSINEARDNYGFSDQVNLSGALEYVNNPASVSYADRVVWRMGYSFESNYVTINGDDFRTHQVTTGVGFPVSQGAGVINVGYIYSTRGQKSSNALLEQAHTIQLNFNIRDVWFRKRVYD